MPLLSDKQKSIWCDLQTHARWNVHAGAASSGKTYLGYYVKALRMRQLPAGNCLLVGKTQQSYCRNVLDPMREIWGEAFVSPLHGNGTVELFGRRCYVYGANDEKAKQKIQGLSLVYCDGDEFATWPESFFGMLKSRLRTTGATCDLTCNPEGPFHWAKKFIDETGGLRYWHYVIDDNPFLDPDYVSAIKSEYTGMWFQRYILGLWVAAEGAIYGMLDTSPGGKHVVDELPPMRDYWVGVDYGTANPTVFLLVGLGEDNCLYVVDECVWNPADNSGRQRTDAQHSAAFREWLKGHGVRPHWVFIDPSAASFRLQLFRDGVKNLAAANNSVLDGIRRVGSILGSERLKFHKRCKITLGEMVSYVWDPKAQKIGEDAPLKVNDHGPDALRYIINGTQMVWGKWLRS